MSSVEDVRRAMKGAHACRGGEAWDYVAKRLCDVNNTKAHDDPIGTDLIRLALEWFEAGFLVEALEYVQRAELCAS